MFCSQLPFAFSSMENNKKIPEEGRKKERTKKQKEEAQMKKK